MEDAKQIEVVVYPHPVELPRGLRVEYLGPGGFRRPAKLWRNPRSYFITTVAGELPKTIEVFLVYRGRKAMDEAFLLCDRLRQLGWSKIYAEGDDRNASRKQ